jgi:hypothetical protein
MNDVPSLANSGAVCGVLAPPGTTKGERTDVTLAVCAMRRCRSAPALATAGSVLGAPSTRIRTLGPASAAPVRRSVPSWDSLGT